MEIKRSDTATKTKDITANVASTFDNFPWTAIQQSSNGTNVVNAINQLLSMYHPNDGIIAYERILKTLLILSENLDNDLQQQIISIVPFPKGVSNEKIRNLIYKTIEIIKSTNMSLRKEVTSVPDENLNAETYLKENTPKNLDLNEKFVSSMSEVFKGFPPNEISTVHSHIRNVNYMYNTLSYPCKKSYTGQNFSTNVNEQEESLKWFLNPHILCKTNLYQSSAPDCQQDDKYFHLFTDNFSNWNQCNSNLSNKLDQDVACFKKLHKNKQHKNEILHSEASHGFSKTETNCAILYNSGTGQSSKKHSNSCKNRILEREAEEYFDQELNCDQQAIQKDIYKMDVVNCEEKIEATILNTQWQWQTP